jgi:hypothetical protein
LGVVVLVAVADGWSSCVVGHPEHLATRHQEFLAVAALVVVFVVVLIGSQN